MQYWNKTQPCVESYSLQSLISKKEWQEIVPLLHGDTPQELQANFLSQLRKEIEDYPATTALGDHIRIAFIQVRNWTSDSVNKLIKEADPKIQKAEKEKKEKGEKVKEKK